MQALYEFKLFQSKNSKKRQWNEKVSHRLEENTCETSDNDIYPVHINKYYNAITRKQSFLSGKKKKLVTSHK